MIQVTKHGQENEISDKENVSDCDEDDNDFDDLDLSLVEDHELGVTTHLSDSYCSEAEDSLSDSIVKHAWNLTAIVRLQNVLMRLQYFLLLLI